MRIGTNKRSEKFWVAIWSGLAAVTGLALFEFYQLAPVSGELLGKFSMKWAAGFGLLLLVAGLLLALIGFALVFPERLEPTSRRLRAFRTAMGTGRWILAFVILVLPAILLLYTPLGPLLNGAFIRLLLLLSAAAVFAWLTGDDLKQSFLKQTFLSMFLTGLVLIGGLHILAERLSQVNNYPFSMSWSEGNRMYIYSLQANRGLYTLADPDRLHLTVSGRNLLWGLPFLIPGLPIWVHRLWDALLWIFPYLGLGWTLAGFAGLKRWTRVLAAVWVWVFLFQGPVYAPLVLSAWLAAAVAWPNPAGFWRWAMTALGTFAAGFYAALSRWTWLPGPATWGVMLALAGHAQAGGSDFWPSAHSGGWSGAIRRLFPAAVIGVAGLIGGLLANDKLFSPKALKSSTVFAQPLLWYRLLPNVNYPTGILIGLALAVLPVISLLLWLAFTRRWRLDWSRAAAYLVGAIALLGGGIVASVKIGGGNNLHNLDLFLITVAILVAIILREVGWQTLSVDILHPFSKPRQGTPVLPQAALLLACLIPAWNAIRLGEPIQLPDEQTTTQALETLRTRVTKAQKRGEVLFIDQRQLLAFGEIPGITLVPEYEKKLMMDKAMAGDANYFAEFYGDLADRRFVMILTEPLFTNVQDVSYGFQEENNAWVHWVAEPLLCYYAPVETLTEVRTQLLVPRDETGGCPR